MFPPVSSRIARRLLAAGAALALAAAGCGNTDEPDLVNGKDLFVAEVRLLPRARRAGTKGAQGPNLDEAFGPARRDGLGEGTVEGVVLRPDRQRAPQQHRCPPTS